MSWKKISLYGGLVLAMLFWAFSFIWYKQGFKHFEPLALVFFRLLVASIFIFLILIIGGKMEKINKKDYKVFLLLVLVEPLLYFLAESYGMRLVEASQGAIIVSFIPLLTPVFAYWIFKDRISWLNLVGIILSFSGVLFVLIGKGFTLNAPLLGVALMFTAVMCAIGYSLIVVNLARKYKPLTIIWVQSFAGTILFLPIFLVFDLNETLEINLSWEAIAPVIKLGIFPSVFSFMFYNIAIREIGVNRSNVFTNFIPVLAAILAFLILKEEMTAAKILGILLVLAGLLISQKKTKANPNTKVKSSPLD